MFSVLQQVVNVNSVFVPRIHTKFRHYKLSAQVHGPGQIISTDKKML